MAKEEQKPKKIKTVFYVIFGLVGIGMMFIGIPGFNLPTINKSVAKINGQEIMRNQVSDVLSNLRAKKPEEKVENLQREAIEAVIANTLRQQYALNSSYVFSDKALKELIQMQFDDAKVYQAFLDQNRISPKAYQNSLQQEQSIQNYYRLIALSTRTNYGNLDNLRLNQLSQHRNMSVITMPIDSFAKKVDLREENLKKYYEDNKNRYLSEEEVDLDFIVFSEDALIDKSKISKEEIEAEKQKRGTEEKRAGKYLIFDDENQAKSLNEELKTGKKKFEQISAEIKANKISGQEGDLNLGKKGDGVSKEADEALFKLAKIGDNSDLFKTEYGMMLVKLEKIEKPNLSDEAIKTDLAQKKAAELYGQKANELFDAAQSGSDLSLLASSAGLKIQAVKGAKISSLSKDFWLKGNPELQEMIFGEKALAVNSPVKPYELEDRKSLFFVIKARKKPEILPYAEVKIYVIQDYQRAEGLKAQQIKADEIQKAWSSGEEVKLDGIGQFKKFQNLNRINPPTEEIDLLSLDKLLNQEQKFAQFTDANLTMYISKLDRIFQAEDIKIPENITETIKTQEENVVVVDMFNGLDKWLRTRAKISISEDELKSIE